MQYLCKAGQQVRAKAQDSAPDKDRMPLLGAPSLAGQASTGSANAFSRMTVNRIRTTHFAVSTISAGLGKK